MLRAAPVAVLAFALAMGVLFPTTTIAAEATDSPKFWAVAGVQAGDVLHLRDVPSAESRSLARIPPNARGLKHLGCRRNQPPLDQWMRMNEAQRKAALTQWGRIEYQGKEGWVAGRFLKPDSGPAQ